MTRENKKEVLGDLMDNMNNKVDNTTQQRLDVKNGEENFRNCYHGHGGTRKALNSA